MLAGDFFQILVLMELSSNDDLSGNEKGLNLTRSFGISSAILATIGLMSFFIVRDVKIKPDGAQQTSREGDQENAEQA